MEKSGVDLVDLGRTCLSHPPKKRDFLLASIIDGRLFGWIIFLGDFFKTSIWVFPNIGVP